MRLNDMLFLPSLNIISLVFPPPYSGKKELIPIAAWVLWSPLVGQLISAFRVDINLYSLEVCLKNRLGYFLLQIKAIKMG